MQSNPGKTSCARGDTICLHPLQVDNIFAFIRQVAPVTAYVGYLRHQQQVDLWPFDLESGAESSVTWATSVPILIFLGLFVLELGPMNAINRQTSDRRQTKASLNASIRPMGTEAKLSAK